MELSMPTTSAPKRIVVQHPNGMIQLCGLVGEGQPEDLISEAASGWPYAVGLVASKPRYWLYRAIQKPEGLGTFHKEQQ